MYSDAPENDKTAAMSLVVSILVDMSLQSRCPADIQNHTSLLAVVTWYIQPLNYGETSLYKFLCGYG